MNRSEHRKEKYKEKNHKENKPRYSLRLQFTIIFFFLMLGAIGSCWIINSTFLERYYIREKRIALTQMYDTVNAAAVNNSIDSDEFDEQVKRSAGIENISLIVMDAESATVKLHSTDSAAMGSRLWDNLFGKTPDLEERDTISSRYYLVDELVSEEAYSIRIIYDSRMDLKTMELFGVMDDGSFCLYLFG